VNLVECGVCDGLTAHFAMNAAQSLGSEWHGYLYDAWEGMKAEQLLPSESNMAGNYSYLGIESTRRSLTSLAPCLAFNQGFIPDSFTVASNPDSVTWLHIDLNSAKATLAALEFFADKLAPGAIVLFDDYGSVRYADTKHLVDKFLSSRQGMLLPFPTGQGAFIKK
jgi:O-methyltransferase